MRKVVVGTFVTLDGVMQAPGGPQEDPSGGFEHGGWLVPFGDEEFGARMVELTQQAGAVLLGRRTYEIFAAHWPRIGDEDPIAAKLNRVQKYVASRTLDRVEWQNSTLLQGDAGDAVADLRRGEGGEIQVTGSGDLIQTLLQRDLVDELRLWTFPLVLGTGKRLFADGTVPRTFRLVESSTTSTGATYAVLERSGAPTYGSFELEE
jgi:dihydrofolate reductase